MLKGFKTRVVVLNAYCLLINYFKSNIGVTIKGISTALVIELGILFLVLPAIKKRFFPRRAQAVANNNRDNVVNNND